MVQWKGTVRLIAQCGVAARVRPRKPTGRRGAGAAPRLIVFSRGRGCLGPTAPSHLCHVRSRRFPAAPPSAPAVHWQTAGVCLPRRRPKAIGATTAAGDFNPATELLKSVVCLRLGGTPRFPGRASLPGRHPLATQVVEGHRPRGDFDPQTIPAQAPPVALVSNGHVRRHCPGGCPAVDFVWGQSPAAPPREQRATPQAGFDSKSQPSRGQPRPAQHRSRKNAQA